MTTAPQRLTGVAAEKACLKAPGGWQVLAVALAVAVASRVRSSSPRHCQKSSKIWTSNSSAGWEVCLPNLATATVDLHSVVMLGGGGAMQHASKLASWGASPVAAGWCARSEQPHRAAHLQPPCFEAPTAALPQLAAPHRPGCSRQTPQLPMQPGRDASGGIPCPSASS